jgi:hypothetical protein
LWQTQGSTWNAYDPLTGKWLFNLTDVPSGTNVRGPALGDIDSYVLDVENNWLALWNNTQHSVGLERSTTEEGTTTNDYQWRPEGKTVNMSEAYSWNVTIQDLPADSSIEKVIPGDLVLGSNHTLYNRAQGGSPGYTVWALNLNESKGDIGELLWM